MATEVEQLVARLSLDMRAFRREMQAAVGINARTAKSIEGAWASANRKLSGYGRNMAQGLVAPLTGIAAAMSVREVAAYADAWTVAGNKIAAASQISGRQGRSLKELNVIANETRSGITATTDLYAKLLRSTAAVAKSEEEVARATTIVNKAFKAGGAATSEQIAGVLQLSQALGSGILQGDELRSLRENAPLLAQAIADEFDTTIAGLKELGAEGQLTSDRVFKAILRAQPQIEAAFAATNQTIGDGMTKVSNALTEYIGQTDSSLSATGRLTAGLNALADNFETIADTTLKLTAVIAGALVGRAIAGMIVKLGFGTAAIYRFVAALAAARTVAGVSAAIGGLGAVAGPVGLAIGTVLAGALVVFGTRSDEATEAADAYSRALREVEEAAEASGKAAIGAGESFAEAERRRADEAVKYAEEQLSKIRQEISANVDLLDHWTAREFLTKEQADQLKRLVTDLNAGRKSVAQVSDELQKLAGSAPENKWLTEFLNPLIEGLEKARKAARLLRVERDQEYQTYPEDPAFVGHRMNMQREATQRFFQDRVEQLNKSDLEKAIDAKEKEIIEAGGDIVKAMSAAAIRLRAEQEVAWEMRGKEVGGSVDDYVNQVVGAESGGDPDAKNPMSSATGLGQFISSTWIAQFKKAFPENARQMSDEAILAYRKDAAISKQLIRQYAAENAELLRDAGVAVNSMALHLAHFLGPQGAINVLKAPSGTPVSQVLGADAIRANPTILGGGKTVDDVIAYGERRAGMTTSGTKRLDARDNFAATLKEHQAYIDSLKAETQIRAALNPLIDDFGKAMSTLEAAQYLLTEAQREGTEAGKELRDVQQLLSGDLSGLSPVAREQALAMRALAEETGKAEAAGNQLTESQDRLKQSSDEFRSFGKDVLGGFIRDLRDGKSATEALGNALNKIADKLLDIALNSIFGIGQGGGLAGFAARIFGFADGGHVRKMAVGGRVRGPGGPRGDKIPAMLSDGEHVTRAAMAKKYGPLLDMINNDALPQLLHGGWITDMPMLAGRGGQAVHVTVGVSADKNGNLLPFVESVAQSNIRQAAPQIASGAVQQSVKAVRRQMPGMIAEAQTRSL